MHEHAVAKDIVRRALREVDGVSKRIASLSISVGSDEHIDPEALSFGITVASVETAAEGADVQVRATPGEGVLLETIDVK